MFCLADCWQFMTIWNSGRDESGKVRDRRTTNAKRYWNAYSSRPAKTSQTIKENLNAYERKLTNYEWKKFEEWTLEIMTHMSGDMYSNMALSEWYLPGYYKQLEYMKNHFYNNTQEDAEEEE